MCQNIINKLNKLTLLIVDDNEQYLNNMTKVLEAIFSKVYKASTFKEAVELIEKRPHIALLDIELNEESGIELAKKFNVESEKSAIIFVSGFSEKEYLLDAIKLNVVDYVIKPATLAVLMESFNKALKRLGDELFSELDLGDGLIYNYTRESLELNEKEIILGAKERRLLILFVENIGRVIKKEDIADVVWPYSYMSDSALKNLILELRKKVGKDKIVNVRGSGWIFKV